MRKSYRLLVAVVIAALLLAVLPVLVLAVLETTLTVVNNTGTTYTYVPAKAMMNNAALAAGGYTLPSQLDVLIKTALNVAVPHMPATNKSMFIAPTIHPNSNTKFFWSAGNTPKSNHEIVVGTGGYITTLDDPALEPSDSFQIDLEDIELRTTGTFGEKHDAIKFSYNATTNVLTVIIGNNETPDVTLTATGVTPGVHDIRLMSTAQVSETVASQVFAPTGPGDVETIPLEDPNGMAHWDIVDDHGNVGDPFNWDEKMYADWYYGPSGYDLYAFTLPTIVSVDTVRVAWYGAANAIENQSFRFKLKLLDYDLYTEPTDAFPQGGVGWGFVGKGSKDYETNPITTEEWNGAQLNDMQFGLYISESSFGSMCVEGFDVELINFTYVTDYEVALYVDDMNTAADTDVLPGPIADNANNWVWSPLPRMGAIKVKASS